MDNQKAVSGGRVDVGDGKKKTLWQLIKAGLVQIDNPPSKHRAFTHSRKGRGYKKRRRQIAKASRRRNRAPKRRTGVRPVR
jgi:hypothetical protein